MKKSSEQTPLVLLGNMTHRQEIICMISEAGLSWSYYMVGFLQGLSLSFSLLTLPLSNLLPSFSHLSLSLALPFPSFSSASLFISVSVSSSLFTIYLDGYCGCTFSLNKPRRLANPGLLPNVTAINLVHRAPSPPSSVCVCLCVCVCQRVCQRVCVCVSVCV